MKKVFLLALLPMVFSACMKSNSSSTACNDVPPSVEEPQIIAYCNANDIIYTKDSSGLFYQIIDAGTNPKPTISSSVSVTYVAKFLSGTVLDQQTTPVTNRLTDLIDAWKVGLPLIGKGGHIKMVAPSSMCYGCYGYPGAVPTNTILYFDISLTDVQ